MKYWQLQPQFRAMCGLFPWIWISCVLAVPGHQTNAAQPQGLAGRGERVPMATFSSAPHGVSRAGAPPPPHPAGVFAGTHTWLCSRGCFHLQNLEAASPQRRSTKHFCKPGAAGQQTWSLCNSGWDPFPNVSLLRGCAPLGRRVPRCWCQGLLSTRLVCGDVCPYLLTGSVGLGHQRSPFGWQNQSLRGGWVWAGGCIWVAASDAVSGLQEDPFWACGGERSMSNPHWCDGAVRAFRDILRQKSCGLVSWRGMEGESLQSAFVF